METSSPTRQVDEIAETVAGASEGQRAAICHRLDRLRQRSLALDAAVILGTLGGAATCVAVMTLFYGALWNGVVASMLYGSFAIAILCTIGALCAFAYEVTISTRSLRLQLTHQEREAVAVGAREGRAPNAAACATVPEARTGASG